MYQEKPILLLLYPYRKPTQVDEERILRPTAEALLRNSAKWPRNLGRRGACESRPQRIGSSNCLAKTQVYACLLYTSAYETFIKKNPGYEDKISEKAGV